jgi:hypothetical protein
MSSYGKVKWYTLLTFDMSVRVQYATSFKILQGGSNQDVSKVRWERIYLFIGVPAQLSMPSVPRRKSHGSHNPPRSWYIITKGSLDVLF